LKAEVDDADLPSDSLAVNADLSGLGGPSEVPLRDDGINPDPVEGDGEFTLEFIPPLNIAAGTYEITVTVTDRYFAYADETLDVEIVSVTDCDFRISEEEVDQGEVIFIELRADSKVPIGEVLFISDVMGGDGSIELMDDGRNGDRVAGDSVYSRNIEIAAGPGIYNYSVRVSCTSGNELYLTQGQIEVLVEFTGAAGENGTVIILMLIAGSIMIILVLAVGIMLLNRSSRRHRNGLQFEDDHGLAGTYPIDEQPLQAVIIAEVSE
jgi:hypothetical protein